MTMVITADRLRSMLAVRDIIIVDTRPFSAYSESHIPRAVNLDLMQFHWIDTSREGISEFNRQAAILLGNIGVSPKKLVVFYDDISGPSAARGVWLLQYFSHGKVAMLDGGLNHWKAIGYKTEAGSNPNVHSKFHGRPNPGVLADYSRTKSAIENKKRVILDARSREEYDGSAVRASRAGHIPTAINIDWNRNLDQDSFKSSEELLNLYSKIPRDAEVITYCQGGYRAANTYVVLKLLGYKNVKMYLGSWGEWGNKPDLPVSSK